MDELRLSFRIAAICRRSKSVPLTERHRSVSAPNINFKQIGSAVRAAVRHREAPVGNASPNIKLDSVLADVLGKSGRAIIEALIAGETNPAKLANLADRRVKASQEELREAHRGQVRRIVAR
jgi:hypothetical protein